MILFIAPSKGANLDLFQGRPRSTLRGLRSSKVDVELPSAKNADLATCS